MSEIYVGTDRISTHQALDDAIEQGLLFCNMLAENLAAKGKP